MLSEWDVRSTGKHKFWPTNRHGDHVMEQSRLVKDIPIGPVVHHVKHDPAIDNNLLLQLILVSEVRLYLRHVGEFRG